MAAARGAPDDLEAATFVHAADGAVDGAFGDSELRRHRGAAGARLAAFLGVEMIEQNDSDGERHGIAIAIEQAQPSEGLGGAFGAVKDLLIAALIACMRRHVIVAFLDPVVLATAGSSLFSPMDMIRRRAVGLRAGFKLSPASLDGDLLGACCKARAFAAAVGSDVYAVIVESGRCGRPRERRLIGGPIPCMSSLAHLDVSFVRRGSKGKQRLGPDTAAGAGPFHFYDGELGVVAEKMTRPSTASRPVISRRQPVRWKRPGRGRPAIALLDGSWSLGRLSGGRHPGIPGKSERRGG